MKLPQTLKQGEIVQTDKNGHSQIEFTNAAKITISPDSALSLSQTLSNNLVFNQADGTIEYTKLGSIPLSVRSLHLLVDQSSGDMTITSDSDNSEVIVDVKTGEITAAYNDSDLNIHEVTVESGKRLVFDDDTRTIVVKTLRK